MTRRDLKVRIATKTYRKLWGYRILTGEQLHVIVERALERELSQVPHKPRRQEP